MDVLAYYFLPAECINSSQTRDIFETFGDNFELTVDTIVTKSIFSCCFRQLQCKND